MVEDVVTGIVLAGGRSSRLGRDKTALVLPGYGSDLLGRTAGILAEAGLAVRISCAADQRERAERAGYPMIADEEPGGGPLQGICSALRETGGPCLVLACDMPFISVKEVRALVWVRENLCGPGSGEDIRMIAWCGKETGRMEPLAALYEPSALELLEKAFQKGDHAVHRAIAEENRMLLEYEADRARAFLNINRPEDLEKVLRTLGG